MALRQDIKCRQGINKITERIIGSAIEVHRELGPGLLESAYEECLCYELGRANFKCDRQIALPVTYKDIELNCGYKLDVVVEDVIVLELKAVERLMPIHKAQLLTYLRLCNRPIGLLINFNVPVLKEGIRRLLYDSES